SRRRAQRTRSSRRQQRRRHGPSGPAARRHRRRHRGAGVQPLELPLSVSASSGTGSELEPGFAGGVRQGGDAPGVLVATTVEHDGLDTGCLGALGAQGTALLGLRGLVALATADRAVQSGRGRHGVALQVVDDLRREVAVRAGHDETGTLRRTRDLLADPDVTALDRGALVGVALEDLLPVCHGLLTRLSDLAADDFALVLDALGLVRVGLA